MPRALEVLPEKKEPSFRFLSRPNCSLTKRGRKQVFWSLVVLTLLIACAFAALGYWLTLPFAGLEIGVLAWAFEALGKRSGDYEALTIDADEVLLERRQGEQIERLELNRQWVSLVQMKERSGGRVRVALRSHGRETELGLFLTDEARTELGGRLQTWFRSGR
jgi:uncharacterized membrane protein